VHVAPDLLDQLVARFLGHAGEQRQPAQILGLGRQHQPQAARVTFEKVGPLGGARHDGLEERI
jgi:hypothetical protein